MTFRGRIESSQRDKRNGRVKMLVVLESNHVRGVRVESRRKEEAEPIEQMEGEITRDGEGKRGRHYVRDIRIESR